MALKSTRKWQLLSVFAFAVPLIAIALVQYRWVEELRQRSEMLALQENREAALRAVSLLEEQMTSARLETLPAVVHADIVELRLEPMSRVFDAAFKRFPYIDSLFVWSSTIPSPQTLFYRPDAGGFRVDADRFRRLPSEVWEIYGGTLRFAEFRCVASGPPCQIVVHRILDDEDASLKGLVGFTVNLDSFARDFVPSFFDAELRPMLERLLDSEDVSVALFDESGQKLFGASGKADSTAFASVEFPVSFATPMEAAPGRTESPRWRLSAATQDSVRVQAIVRRGALSNIAIVGIGILVLALGSALMARSSVREARLSNLKSRFISGISHELKTPLSMIRLYSEMLELGRVPRDSERELFYRKLRQEAEIMGDMLEEILDFSRLETEQRAGPHAACRVPDVLEEAVSMYEGHSVTHQAVSLSFHESLPQVRGERSALVRAIYNLLDNASKYSASNEPISVAAYRQNGFVAVEVADKGIGISSEDLPHIFERFYRGSTPPGTKGTGLGLSIVQTIVKAHGGRVEVQSEPGRGSRFTLLLPGQEDGARS